MKRVLVLVLLALVPARVAAEEALLMVPRAPLTPGATVSGSVVVIDGGSPIAAIDLPVIPGLRLQRVAASMQRVDIVNGRQTVRDIARITITAEAIGQHQVPAFTVRLQDGRELATQPLVVEVRAAPAAPGEPVFSAAFEPATAVVNQTVTLVYSCALPEGLSPTAPLGIGPPPQAVVVGKEEVGEGVMVGADGRNWTTFSVRWRLQFPEPGEIEVRGQQEYVRVERTRFGSSAGERRRAPVQPGRLTVVPVPTEGRPADWSGLVGEVAVTAALERTRIAADEGTRLTVTVRGPYAAQARRPVLAEVPGLRALPRDETARRPADERVFSWDLVPAGPGRYALPPISLPWFDAEARLFRRSSAAPLTLEVVPGRRAALDITGAPAPTGAAVPEAAPIALLPPPQRGAGATVPAPILTPLAFVAGLLAALVTGLLGRRGPRRLHRGHRLAHAIRAGDLPAAAAALQALRPALSGEALAAADRLAEAIDRARFGGAAGADLAALARPLEEQP